VDIATTITATTTYAPVIVKAVSMMDIVLIHLAGITPVDSYEPGPQ